MTDLLFHTAAAASRDLTERLQGLLDELPADDGARLRQLLVVDEHDRPRMVLTGQYSSGKSTLIKALTDNAAQVVIDSAVATDTVDIFTWDGLVDLVDTPGVQAGLNEHDELAEEALRAADLVLFTVTVDLFDDRLVDHLHHVTSDLRKAPQLLIVITKSRSLAAADGVRQAAVEEALGTFADHVPWVECDAKTYLDGLNDPDPARAARRRQASNLDDLRATINRIALERGDLARFRVPLQQVALAAGEALATLVDDPEQEAVLAVLARQRSALTTRRGLLDSALERKATEFRTACIRAAERLADTAESIEESPSSDWGLLEAASKTLNEELTTAYQQFVEDVSAVVDSQLADFTSEIREIETSPYARQLLALDVHTDVAAHDVSVDTGLAGKPGPAHSRGPAWGPQAVKHLDKFRQSWGAGDGVRKAAGSKGHQIVYKAGKGVGIKFKPYQAVRWANNIGKAAAVGAFVLPVALETYAVIKDERAETAAAKEKIRRRNTLIGSVLAQSDDISRRTLLGVRAELDHEFGAAISEIDTLVQSVRDNQTSRSDLGRALRAVEAEAVGMLDRLSTPGQG